MGGGPPRAHVAGREPSVRRHAGAAIGAAHELDRLRGRQKRRLAVALALLELPHLQGHLLILVVLHNHRQNLRLMIEQRVKNISCNVMSSIIELNLSNHQIMVIFLSFISVTKALPFVMSKVQKDTKMICLIKPQFELSKKQLNKNGIVKNEEYIKDVILKIKQFFTELKWAFIDIKESPIVGRSGNKEFLLYAKKQ